MSTSTPHFQSANNLPKRLDEFVEDEESWRDFAACKDIEDWEIFYPDAPPEQDGDSNWTKLHERVVQEREKKAKTYCWSCKVREECLEDALMNATHNRYGIRGGLTVMERRRIFAERGIRMRVGHVSEKHVQKLEEQYATQHPGS